ncbi:alpha/beta hydrolase [Mycobacterium sp. CBMA 234]|uniref:alpha/beta fold hydrolase n=1 Tax=Mycolicibacterium sp. CBMA 234 TaxID=1918495 RepID=UPI0012DE6E82|nr:alpha/beta hydrolase [Mycolicibacterium sp. CBMA 234]MUL68197.1 alpha/beta hydrolase [Mycolicibacterium sp. CBMA 234]
MDNEHSSRQEAGVPKHLVGAGTRYRDAPTKSVVVGETRFAYRELGTGAGVPVIFLNHLAANLDNWDPRVVDGIAAQHRVVTFDARGVGATGGKTPGTIEAMAHDAVAFIRALGFDQVDLLGLSMGGFIAQVIALEEPTLVRRVILAGTGPAGGEGIIDVTRLTYLDTLRALVAFKDPKEYLFFTRTANGKAQAKAFVKRLKERVTDRDKAISVRAFLKQLTAIHAWALQDPADLSRIPHAVLVANGEEDRMVPTSNSYDLTRRIPNSTLRIYPDAGHGGIFQFHERFVTEALDFLRP